MLLALAVAFQPVGPDPSFAECRAAADEFTMRSTRALSLLRTFEDHGAGDTANADRRAAIRAEMEPELKADIARGMRVWQRFVAVLPDEVVRKRVAALDTRALDALFAACETSVAKAVEEARKP